MTAKQWKKAIEEQMKIDDDYLPSFDITIKILSEMLEERDRIYQAYIEGGANPVFEFQSSGGNSNPKPNPLWKQWQEINTSALLYLRDLGLTAAGLRKLQGQLPDKPAKSCEEIMRQIRGRKT